ncbi:MAG: hypothetical protein BACD_03380 [Bacteroides rodentium]
MAKIGVLTFHDTTDNYGQVLQYLATQIYLESRGHEAHLLYIKPSSRSIARKVYDKIYRLFSQHIPTKNISEIQKEKNHIYYKWFSTAERMEKEHPRYFEVFRRKQFKISEGTIEEICQMDFDAFCVGSDQTWGNFNKLYFLSWVRGDKKRISIAPSIAHYEFSTDEIKKLKKSVLKFDFITVREKKGIDFCNRIGYKGVQHILDPTFLINSSNYDKYIQPIPEMEKEPFILLYLLGSEINLNISDVYKYAQKKKLNIKYVASQGRDDEYPKIYPNIGEWLWLVKNAQYIMTNSFHGMVFSIIYKVPMLNFPVIGIMKGMNSRINDLLSYFNLNDRIYTGDLEAIETPINWSQKFSLLDENKIKLDKLMKNIGY